MSKKIEGGRVNFILDEYTLHLEDLLIKQNVDSNKPKPNRSEILRVVYRQYLQSEVDIFAANELYKEV